MKTFIFALLVGFALPAAAECGLQFEVPFHRITPQGEHYHFTVDPECVFVGGYTFVNKGQSTHIATQDEIDMVVEGPSPDDCAEHAPLEVCTIIDPIPGDYILHVKKVKGRVRTRTAVVTHDK